jgi:site-specific recombinase XerD
VATFFYAGVRVSEFSTLRVTDIDVVGARIRVNQGKGARDRVLYMPPRLARILTAYLSDTRLALVGGAAWEESASPHHRSGQAGGAYYYWPPGPRARCVYHSVSSEAEARRILDERAPQPKDSGYVFVHAGGHRLAREGQPMRTRAWYWVIRNRAQQLLGVKLSPHKLRHTCATYLLYHGAQLETIQRLLGHADVRTTMIYLHMPQKRQEEEISRIFG